jgi:hypothetical protein
MDLGELRFVYLLRYACIRLFERYGGSSCIVIYQISQDSLSPSLPPSPSLSLSNTRDIIHYTMIGHDMKQKKNEIKNEQITWRPQ